MARIAKESVQNGQAFQLSENSKFNASFMTKQCVETDTCISFLLYVLESIRYSLMSMKSRKIV